MDRHPTRPQIDTPWINLVDLLLERASLRPHDPVLSFLREGEDVSDSLTFGELDRNARTVASKLISLGLTGQRALLLYPSGLDFVSAFFGCMYAGVTAVPVYPPRRNRSLDRLSGIVSDCDASVVLTTAESLALVEKPLESEPRLKALPWLTTDKLPADLANDWRMPAIKPDTLAFLQYTSGSTSTPKGVMLTHGNLLANSACIAKAFGYTSETRAISWLPLYHDMGLIGGVLQPVYVGYHMMLMSPTAFLSSPFRWLQAISRYRLTASVAPNFAYDLCIRRVTAEQKARLDLSTWHLTATGGEPIHSDTLDRFAEAFEPCGFRREIFVPCYGLAESSLMVTSRMRSEPIEQEAFRKAELSLGRAVPAMGSEDAQTLVGCGRPLNNAEVFIVDPQTRKPRPEGEIGEIWTRGPSVGKGYWNRPEETSQAFDGRLADFGDGPFLRTGDLGFLHGGELYVTGRIKDLLILYGRNYYPQDIERAVEESHPAIRHGCCAAFGVHADGEERLVVLAEVEHPAKKWNLDEVVSAARRAVSEQHELSVQTLVLIKMSSIPRTSSGKIQRRASRELYLNGKLDVVQEWSAGPAVEAKATSAPTVSKADVRRWLVDQVAQRLGLRINQIDPREPLALYGLDSSVATALASEMETWLGRRVSPVLLYEHPSIESLAGFLSGEDDRRVSHAATDVAAPGEPIAIIGIGCRFPGANGPEEFWKLLRDGVNAVREVPADRWDAAEYYDADLSAPGKMNSRWGGFLDRVDQFDAAFFGVSPREAVHVDPQQRILLEVAWEALEDAGLAPDRLARSRTGVFVGITGNDYGILRAGSRDGNLYASTGNALCIAANRLSYTFDFRGPSLAVDTACSSSLTAVHLACQSIGRGESDMALAGGSNLLLAPEVSLHLSKGAVFSPDGRCATFAAGANGMVRGEGVGLVVLKRLSKALADGDPIYAVIRGTAANQDGRSNGLTAPNQQAQEAMLHEAYRHANLAPSEVDYIEAHGTGTALGDPIEASALGAVMAAGRPAERPLAIGSVKTNIGHLEAAAGVAGLIKAALTLRHGEIPASLHFDAPNPLIPFDELRLRVQAQRGEWPTKEGPRTAGVSSFGFGGTNVHVVLQGMPGRDLMPVEDLPGPFLLPVSARSSEALVERVRAMREWLGNGSNLADLCFTATSRRGHLDHRAAFVGATPALMAQQIDEYLLKSPVVTPTRQAPRVAFVCSGQGPKWGTAGRQLLASEPAFRAALEAVDALIRKYGSWSLLEELQAEEDKSRLDEIVFAQPAHFALQVALAALWKSWGVEPAAVVGHSMGEVAAACLAGVLTLEDAVRLIVQRGQLLGRVAGKGAMAAVELTREAAEELLRGYGERVEIAAINDPTSLVLTGDANAIDEVLAKLTEQGVFCRKLRQTVAGHSRQMDPLRFELERSLARLIPQGGSLPFYSTVVGEKQDGESLDAAYWGMNLREPVRFHAAVEQMVRDGYLAFVELSPHTSLSGVIHGTLMRGGNPGVAVASLRRGEDERGTLLSALAGLYPFGVEIHWDRLYPRRANVVRLPSYPWRRERYWLVPETHRKDVVHARLNGHHANGNGHNGHAKNGVNGHHAEEAGADLLYERQWMPRSLPGFALSRPVEFPGPSSIAEELRPKAVHLAAEAGLDKLIGLEPMVNALASAYVVNGLSALGVALAPGKRFFATDFKLPAKSERLLGRLLEMLRTDGMLARQGDEWTVTGAWRKQDTSALKLAILDRSPAIEAELTLLDQCAVHLAPVLRGEVDPVSVIFPGGNASAVERVYQDSATSQVYNALAREAVTKAVKSLPAGRTLRVLEIGAGTGGLTQALLPLLPAGHTEYVFTDVSAAFMSKAERKFSQYPFIRYEVFDAERDPASQGYAPGQFDLVLAANVLHATYDLRQSLRNARQVLAPGGVLMLLEVTKPQRWLDLVFGLTEGWWRFGDTDIRPDHPLLSAAKWRTVLAEAGFEDPASLSPASCGESEQSVLLARNGAMSSTPNKLAPAANGTFLILADQGGVGARIAERLTAAGGHCVVASPEEDLSKRFQELPRTGAVTVVHLGSLGTSAVGPQSLGDVLTGQRRGSESLLPVFREMLQGDWAESPRLWVVTRGAQGVAGEITDAGIVHAPLIGLGRVLAQEHPTSFGGLIDLAPDTGADESAETVAAELGRRSAENEVTYRRSQRFVARLARRPAGSTSLHWHAQTNGTYLVTGGLGDLGLQVARWLVERGARRLLLTGRTALPPRRQWASVEPSSRAGKQVAAIRELEAKGVHVHVVPADVADETSLRNLLDDFRAEGWPAIRGVVHVAGVEQEKTLGLLQPDELHQVLRPKLLGGWLLDRLLADDPLDLFVLFSSGASLLGSPGMGSYVAANSFLDALAHRRRSQGKAGLSVNWGPWEGLGMATVAGRASRFALHGVGHITADQAFRALDQLLGQNHCAQAGVMAMDWAELMGSYPALAHSPLLRSFAREAAARNSGKASESSLTREMLLEAPAEKRHPMLAVYVAAQAARVLGLPPRLVDLHQPLNTLGLDSLMAVELKNHLECRFGVTIPVRALLGGASLDQLVDQILQPLGESVASSELVEAANQEEYPLSHGQWSLWFLNQLAPGSAAYNVAFGVAIHSKIDVPALTQTLQHLVDRHPSLRTTYSTGDGKPTQRVHGVGELLFQEFDASGMPQEELDRRLVVEAHKPLDLATGPVLHASLYRREAQPSVLLLVLHHIACDFWSLQVFLGELRTLYPAVVAGTPPTLTPPRATYADFVKWQSEMLTSPEGQHHWDYWRGSLAGELPILNLPTDMPRAAVMTFNGATQPLNFDEELTAKLRALARSQGTTLYTVLLAAFKVLLYRWTAQEDIVVGSPLNGRTRAEFGDVFGYFVNPVPMRANLAGAPTFRSFLAQVQDVVLGALEHQDFPAAVMVERLQVPRDPGRSPLFQTLFVLDRPHRLGAEEAAKFVLGEAGGAVEVGGLQIESYPLPHEASMFDVVLFVVEGGDTISGSLQYNNDLFRPETMERMAGHLHTLLSAFVADPEVSVGAAPMLSPRELCQLDGWNSTTRAYPLGMCVHHLIEEQATANPAAEAVIFGDQRITYGHLDRRANQLARRLKEVGVGPEVLVGVHLDKSVEMVVGVLGVLKSGGAYVPLDPTYPAERLRHMLADSGARVVLTQGEIDLPSFDGRVICLDNQGDWIAAASDERFDGGATADNLAYVLFSSGSTGSPKGSMIPHKNVVNQYWAWEDSYRLRADTTCHLQNASFSFDVCTGEMVRALCSGKKLVLCPRDLLLDPPALYETMRREGADCAEFVPAVLRSLVRYVESANLDLGFMRLLMVGSDSWFVQEHRQVLKLCGPGTRFVNSYGLTEVTIDSLFYEGGADDMRPDGMVPIGKLFGNSRAYILDANRQRVPVGVIGELYLGGPGVARGYRNHPEQTALRFLPDTFSTDEEATLYRTGDLTRWRPDGNVEFLGRLDTQVKLRGFRIELGDIESALVQAPGVRGCAVIIREDSPGARRLVAYFVPNSATETSAAELRNFLRSRLPEYMVPAVFVPLERLPLTANGKVDRQGLPVPDLTQLRGSSYVPPRNPTEATLCKLWEELLGVERVGIHDNFFELGGESILAIHLITRAGQEGLRVTPRQLFRSPTVAELAEECSAMTGVNAEQGVVTGKVPLTPIQRWFFEMEVPNPHHFNQALLLEVRHKVDPVLLSESVRHLMLHHDSLRLRFRRVDGTWTQEISKPTEDVPVQYVNVAEATDPTAAMEAEIAEMQASLNLDDGPILRVAYFDLGPTQPGRLFLAVHHLAIDAVSWRIVLADLQSVYAQLSLGQIPTLQAKSTSWKSWAERLHELAKAPETLGEAGYWLTTSRRAAAARVCPLDHSGTGLDNTVATGGTVQVSLEANETRSLMIQVPAANGTQVHDVLVSALAATLQDWTGSADIGLDLEGHGREDLVEDVDLSRTVGWFTTLYPVYLSLESASTVAETLGAVKDQLREVPRRGIGYGLLRYLASDSAEAAALADLPHPEVSFNYLGTLDSVFPETSPFSMASESIGQAVCLSTERSHLLEVIAYVREGRLHVVWGYGQALHQRETVEKLAEQFLDAVRDVIATCVGTAEHQEKQNGHTNGYGLASSFFAHTRTEHRPLAQLIAEGKLPPVDSAALGYLPGFLLGHEGVSPEMITRDWFGNMPFVTTIQECSLGRIAGVWIPRFDFQLYQDKDDIVDQLLSAMGLAAQMGARCVSLTGLLPSATDYGLSLAKKAKGKGLPSVTTGHATTTATVVLSIGKALSEAGRDIQGEHVAFLGLGSIGVATLRLLLASQPHPAELTLCDVVGKRAVLEQLKVEVREKLGYQGQINLLESKREAPIELYNASLIVGATNAPDVLDVRKMRPGAVLVDDSWPHAFRPDLAAERLRTRGDILYTEGGILRAPEPIRQVLYMPPMLEQVLPVKLQDWSVRLHPEQITSCVLGGLLSATDETLPPTLGFIEAEGAMLHHEALNRLGFDAAPLHCDEVLLDEELIRRFRQQYGQSEAIFGGGS